MQRPRDAWHLSPDEGAALIERLARHTLRAEDRCVLVQVVRWLLWLVCVVQEAKRSLTWLRTVLCGKGAHGSQARAPAAATSRAMGGEREDGGARRSMKFAQFIAVCSSQILAAMPGSSASFASELRANTESFIEVDASTHRLTSTIYKLR